jgi:signal transduction histidine kinase
VLGAIHLADEREGQVPLKAMEFIESVAPLIGEAFNRFNLEEEIRESESRLRSLSSQLLTVQENERRRVAREIHDGLGQMLTATKFKMENIIQQKGKGEVKTKGKSLETLIPLMQESIEEVRRIQMDLRPSTLDDLGILATIGWFCREFEKIYSTIYIETQLKLQEHEVSDSLKTVIYRVMQEALNNIAKYSKADLVHLSLKKEENKIELEIEDNGIGFDIEDAKKGFGLSSMRERTELSGGTFAIKSIIGKGTTIKAIWPT